MCSARSLEGIINSQSPPAQFHQSARPIHHPICALLARCSLSGHFRRLWPAGCVISSINILIDLWTPAQSLVLSRIGPKIRYRVSNFPACYKTRSFITGHYLQMMVSSNCAMVCKFQLEGMCVCLTVLSIDYARELLGLHAANFFPRCVPKLAIFNSTAEIFINPGRTF